MVAPQSFLLVVLSVTLILAICVCVQVSDCDFNLHLALSDPGIKPGSPALEADALTSEPPGKLAIIITTNYY